MNKLTKIGAAALFTLFLAACDKAADKPVEPAKPAETTTEAAKPVEATTTEAVKSAETTTEAAKPAETTTSVPAAENNVQGFDDFQKLVLWNQEQEQKLATLQGQLAEKLNSKDPKQLEEAQQLVTEQFSTLLASLEALEIKDETINNLKQKTKDMFVLSQDIMSNSIKAIAAPTEELQKTLIEKTQKISESAAELQKLYTELQQKFAK